MSNCVFLMFSGKQNAIKTQLKRNINSKGMFYHGLFFWSIKKGCFVLTQ